MSDSEKKSKQPAALKKWQAEQKAKGLPVGRQKGTPNKLTSVVRSGILEVYERCGGVDGFLDWVQESKENKRLFYTNLMRSLPKELESNAKGSGITVVVNGSAQLKGKGQTIDVTPEDIEDAPYTPQPLPRGRTAAEVEEESFDDPERNLDIILDRT